MSREAIERSLLEVDGACRDINFSEYISTTGAVDLLEFIGGYWKLEQAMNGNGESIPAADFRTFLSQEKGSLHTLWAGETNPRHLQGYLYWVAPDQVFCELTFFSQDLDAHRFTLDGFLGLLAKLVKVAHSQEYYVRVEDGVWSHQDGGDKRSVIFSHASMSLPRV